LVVRPQEVDMTDRAEKPGRGRQLDLLTEAYGLHGGFGVPPTLFGDEGYDLNHRHGTSDNRTPLALSYGYHFDPPR
jgi:hypothetical protein